MPHRRRQITSSMRSGAYDIPPPPDTHQDPWRWWVTSILIRLIRLVELQHDRMDEQYAREMELLEAQLSQEPKAQQPSSFIERLLLGNQPLQVMLALMLFAIALRDKLPLADILASLFRK